jgi:hypothetical protein
LGIRKDRYLDKETGEIKERKKSENRYQSPKSVRKSINKLMDLIRCNATETSYCKWITLTYADAMTDHKKFMKMGKCFSGDYNTIWITRQICQMVRNHSRELQ